MRKQWGIAEVPPPDRFQDYEFPVAGDGRTVAEQTFQLDVIAEVTISDHP